VSATPPPAPPWPVVVAVMLTALLEVLDLTVVNVSLPHMIGSFGATPDQITWVVTSYMISTAIVMPLTGYLSARFGRRGVLLWSITGFVLASGLCGAAWSLESMVVFRLAQGAFGAVLIPLSQTVLLDAFPRDRRGQAMAIWGIAIMVAPIVGPTIGGYITEHFVWRWVFYVNVPIGALALLLALGQVPATPRKPGLVTDWTGLVLMSLALGSLQAVLDLGHHRDWFESKLIMALALVAVVSGVVFVVRGLSVPHNIIDLRLFRDRNFTLGCVLIAGYCLAMYGTIVLLPLLSQRLLGYPADTAGLIFLPRGAVSAVLMILIGNYLAHRVDARKLIGLGFVFTTVACWHMAHYTLAVDMWGLIWPGVIQGIGMALIFGQISVVTFDTIPRERADEAAGLYSVTRTLGSALGVALSGTLFVRQEQVHWNLLGGHVSEFNPDWQAWLERAALSMDEPATPAIFARELLRQAQMQSFADLYWAISLSFLFLMPFVALLRRPHAH
jgi:DHA2 family multidrug resistance protein